jgi:hypothetical protein
MHSWQSLVLGQSLRSISLPSPISSLKPSREIQHISNSKEQNFPEQCRMLITGSVPLCFRSQPKWCFKTLAIFHNYTCSLWRRKGAGLDSDFRTFQWHLQKLVHLAITVARTRFQSSGFLFFLYCFWGTLHLSQMHLCKKIKSMDRRETYGTNVMPRLPSVNRERSKDDQIGWDPYSYQ